jgi:hypothetical protein
MRIEIFTHEGRTGFAPAHAFLSAHFHQLIAAFDEIAEDFARGIGRGLGGGAEGLAERGQHARIDLVGLGQEACGAGEVTRAAGIDAGEAHPGASQRLTQGAVVAPRRLEHDEAAAKPLRQRRANRRRVVEPLAHAHVEQIE